MNKIELAKRISERMSLPYQEIICFLEAFHAELAEVFREEDRLIIKSFGTYSLWKQAGRMGRNPKNGKMYMIPPRMSLKFKPGKGLLARLNEDIESPQEYL